MEDIIAWLGLVVRSVDSSLVGEGSRRVKELVPVREAKDAVVHDRRGLTVLVRNALFRRVRLAAADDHEALGEADVDNGFPAHKWRAALDEYYDTHEDVLIDADARSMAFLAIDESDEDSEHVWHVQQTFSDPDGDHDFAIRADVDLDATQEGDGVVFKDYRVGFIEDLL